MHHSSFAHIDLDVLPRDSAIQPTALPSVLTRCWRCGAHLRAFNRTLLYATANSSWPHIISIHEWCAPAFQPALRAIGYKPVGVWLVTSQASLA